jgi:hypothetical protein
MRSGGLRIGARLAFEPRTADTESMRPPSLLTNDFLRALVGVGQVDLLVGLPTFNNAATVKPIAQAVHVALARHFPRLRTLLLNSDGGSTDGTPDIVHGVSHHTTGEPGTSQTLRTIHRVTTSHPGALGKGRALRGIFAAADLTSARAVAVVDPDITSITPEWIERLVRPVLDQGFDYVAPVYARAMFEGPLVSHIVRPVFDAAYGVDLREPVGGEFGCSGRFAAHCVKQPVWELDLTRFGVDIWLAGEAVSKHFRAAQTMLGPRTPMRAASRLGLEELITHVIGALFTCLDMHAPYWTAAPAHRVLPLFGVPVTAVAPSPDAPDTNGLDQRLRDVRPVLLQCLSPESVAALESSMTDGRPVIGDALWARLLGEMAATHAHGRVAREQLLGAIVPIYLARVASFREAHQASDAATVDAALESMRASCAAQRDYCIAQWKR